MSATVVQLRDLLSTTERIKHLCRPSSTNKLTLLRPQGIAPDLSEVSAESFISESQAAQLGPACTIAITKRVRSAIAQEQKSVLCSFQSVTSGMISLEEYGGVDDLYTVRQLCRLYEEFYKSQLARIRKTTSDVIERYLNSIEAAASHKLSSFSPHALVVLDAAYSHTNSLSQAETSIIAKAAGISAHQVRTWFQNKRNRGKDKKPSAPANRPVSSLPKRAQQQQQHPIKLESQPNLLSPTPAPRRVRGLPKRAAQVSHNAPGTHVLSSYPSSETSSRDHGILDVRERAVGMEDEDGAGRMSRSASFASTSSVSTEAPNGGFISPYGMHLSSSSGDRQISSSSSASVSGAAARHGEGLTQIAVEWGTGMLNIPIEALGGGQAPVFNFTPPSPLNVGFDPTFDPANYAPLPTDAFSLAQTQLSGESVYSPLEMPTGDSSHFPFAFPDNLDLSEGLESIESILTEALSDPKSFEHFSTLAASPQISLDSLSPRSESSESLPSLPSGNVTPGQEYDGASYDFKSMSENRGAAEYGYGNGYGVGSMDEMEGDFFNALEGLLARSPADSFSPSGAVELDSPIALEKKWSSATPTSFTTTPQFIRSMSMMSDMSFHADPNTGMGAEGMVEEESSGSAAIIEASQGIDLSYIASIPLPASPTSSTFSLPREYTPSRSPSLAAAVPRAQHTPERSISLASSDVKQRLTTSTSGNVSPFTASHYTPEKSMDVNQTQSPSQSHWEWIGALPFEMEMEMMEVDVSEGEGGSPDSVGVGKEWEGGMSRIGGMIVQ
uniref:Sxi2 n=1 Tax=Kwoniella heveanensis TaxID=89924 RepID=D1MBN2_9TREE|nr:Sxi2 [Kwoniella heveanensis]